MAVLFDFVRFLRAVVQRVIAYITGSLFAAAAFLYEHLARKTIPGNVVLWGVGAFFVTGSFMAWREQHRSVGAIEIRDRLDELLRRGESLCGKWMDKKRPKLRTNRWITSTRAFVKRHFTVSQFDAFNAHASGIDEKTGEIFVGIAMKLQRSDPEGYELALKVATMVDALKQVRRHIRD